MAFALNSLVELTDIELTRSDSKRWRLWLIQGMGQSYQCTVLYFYPDPKNTCQIKIRDCFWYRDSRESLLALWLSLLCEAWDSVCVLYGSAIVQGIGQCLLAEWFNHCRHRTLSGCCVV